MPDLKDEFDLFRGDLLYGQSRDRGAALLYLAANSPTGPLIVAASNAGAWVTVDNLNIPMAPDQDAAFTYKKNLGDIYWNVQIGVGIDPAKEQVKEQENQLGADFQSKKYSQALDEYYRSIEKHKFSPLSTFNAPRYKLEAEGWKKAGQHLSKDRYYLAIRRACKFGIEHVASQSSGALIHFILNRFDEGTGWEDVLNKKPIQARGREAVIITYSELRFVYKNWDRFKTKVRFYRFEGTRDNPTSFPSCSAPWEDTTRTVTGIVYNSEGKGEKKTLTLAEFWKENYTPYNARRYKTLLDNLLVHPRYINKNQHLVGKTGKTILQSRRVADCCLESDPEMAIAECKEAIRLLTH